MLDHWAQGITTSACQPRPLGPCPPHPRPPEHRPSKHMTKDYHNPGKIKTFAFAFEEWVFQWRVPRVEKKHMEFQHFSSIFRTFLSLVKSIIKTPSADWTRRLTQCHLWQKSWLLPAKGYTNMNILLYLILWSWYIIMLLLDKYEAIIWSHIEKRAENEGSLYRNLGFWWLIVCKLGNLDMASHVRFQVVYE